MSKLLKQAEVFRKLAEKLPHEMSEAEFLLHHHTGHIDPRAYDSTTGQGGMDWLKKERFPDLLKELNLQGDPIELRQSGEKNKYWRHEHRRYLSDQEMEERGLAPTSTTVVAFLGDRPLGYASDEFGSVGVWVADDYQKKGLGTLLLQEHMKQRHPGTRLGQVTPAGTQLAKAYHRKLREDAGVSTAPESGPIRIPVTLFSDGFALPKDEALGKARLATQIGAPVELDILDNRLPPGLGDMWERLIERGASPSQLNPERYRVKSAAQVLSQLLGYHHLAETNDWPTEEERQKFDEQTASLSPADLEEQIWEKRLSPGQLSGTGIRVHRSIFVPD